MRLRDEPLGELPVGVMTVDPDADPAALAEVRRDETVLRPLGDELRRVARRRLQVQRDASVPVVILDEPGEATTACREARVLPRLLGDHAREALAERTRALDLAHPQKAILGPG